MFKIVLTCLLAAACVATPQGGRYSAPSQSFHRAASSTFPSSRSSFGASGDHFAVRGRDSNEFSDVSDERFISGTGGARFSSLGGSGGGGGTYSKDDHSGGFSQSGIGGQRGNGFRSGSAFSSSGNGFQSFPVIEILRDERLDSGDGSYSFLFESANGIQREESGSPTGSDGSVVQQGHWSFTFPDGTPGAVSFIADENGFRAESDLLPVAPPMPAHALEQIEKAERERAAGIIHDGQYREEDHYGGSRSQSVSHGGASSFRDHAGGASFGGHAGGASSFGAHSGGGSSVGSLSGSAGSSIRGFSVDTDDDFRDDLDDDHDDFRGGRFPQSFSGVSQSLSGGGGRKAYSGGVSLFADTGFRSGRGRGPVQSSSRKSYGN